MKGFTVVILLLVGSAWALPYQKKDHMDSWVDGLSDKVMNQIMHIYQTGSFKRQDSLCNLLGGPYCLNLFPTPLIRDTQIQDNFWTDLLGDLSIPVTQILGGGTGKKRYDTPCYLFGINCDPQFPDTIWEL